MVSLDDTTWTWELIFFMFKNDDCVDPDFDGILRKCNRGLALLVEENSQTYNNIFSFLGISDTRFLEFFFVLEFLDIYTFHMPAALHDFPDTGCSILQIVLFEILIACFFFSRLPWYFPFLAGKSFSWLADNLFFF